ncbi:MAG: D-glycero-beta-D-manno-heptose 1-phosphate adenylyltransferase [Bacteroidota bacterium]
MSKLQWIQNKIMDKTSLLRFCQSQKVKGRKIVFTNGCFDILHHGHIDILAKAADEGNILVIGLNTDSSVKRLKGNERPVNNEGDRALLLASLLCVDAVCLFEEDTPLSIIKAINPDVLVKGGDYTKETIVGAAEVEANGGKVVIVPFVSGYSTTDTLRQIKQL